MAGFRFRLDSVLKLREQARDLRRQQLATALGAERAVQEQRRQIESLRELQLSELRSIVTPGEVDVDRAAARRFHAGSLTLDLLRCDQKLRQLQAQTAECRQRLVLADQEVRVLEKLRETQLQEWTQVQLQKEQREREEAWQAANSRGADE